MSNCLTPPRSRIFLACSDLLHYHLGAILGAHISDTPSLEVLPLPLGCVAREWWIKLGVAGLVGAGFFPTWHTTGGWTCALGKGECWVPHACGFLTSLCRRQLAQTLLSEQHRSQLGHSPTRPLCMKQQRKEPARCEHAETSLSLPCVGGSFIKHSLLPGWEAALSLSHISRPWPL